MSKLDLGEIISINHGAGPRSPHWHLVEKEFIANNPKCSACLPSSSNYGINVHHIHPYHICILLGRPDLELDTRNLITLCSTEEGKTSYHHHIVLGHLDDFQLNNDNVIEDITRYQGIEGKALLQESDFKQRIDARPKPFSQWTDQEKQEYRAMLDTQLPPDPGVCTKYGFMIKPYLG